MDNKYLKQLTEAFQKQSPLSQEELKGLFTQNMEFIQEIQGKLMSDNEAEQKQAVETLQEVRAVLEGKLQEVLQQSGMSMADLIAMSQSSQKTTPTEEELIKKTNESFDRLKGVS